MDYIGRSDDIQIETIPHDRFDYIYPSNPTASINPSTPYVQWLNSLTGEMFVCTDNEPDNNGWVGYSGTTIYKSKNPTSVILSSYQMTDALPYGVSFDGDNMISLGSNSDKINIHSGISNLILSSITMSNTYLLDITYLDGNLISCDNTSKTIKVHNGVSTTVTDSIAFEDTGVRAITIANGNLITASSSTGNIYIHDGLSGVIDTTISAPSGLDVSGLAYNGRDLISCGDTSDLIYIHEGVSASVASSFSSPSTRPFGLEWMTGRLFSVDSDTDYIYSHKNEDEL